MNLTELIIDAAKQYRIFGWNVLPLFSYSKSPNSSSFIKENGWKQFEERSLTATEFDLAFSAPNLTGVGFITGAISRTVVLDEDSYKQGGKVVTFSSPMISQSGSGGRHIFGKYVSPVKSMGFRKGVNVEGKGDGGFIVLPPSQVYRKDSEGKTTTEIGKYKWISQSSWEDLPELKEEDLAEFKESKTGDRINLRDYVQAPMGEQHNSLRNIALSILNKFPQEEWDLAEGFIRTEAAKFNPPHPEYRVEKMIQDVKSFILFNPKVRHTFRDDGSTAVKTEPVAYSQMTDEELETISEREQISTGLTALDEILPYRAGYHVVIGNPGSGKGWYATWLAKQFFLLHQKKSVLFSLEMPEALVRARLLQQWSGLTEEQLMDGDLTPAKNLMKQDALLVYPFGQVDTAYQTPENFEKDIKDFYDQGYRVFFFDHLHELEGANSNDTNQKLTEEWGKVFQTICKNYTNIWLIIFVQPNGAAAVKNVLKRTDISGSKSITQKCEVFVSLNRKIASATATPENVRVTQQDRSVYVWVDKNRLSSQQGVGNSVYLSKTGNFVTFPDEDVKKIEEKILQTQESLLEQIIEEKKEQLN